MTTMNSQVYGVNIRVLGPPNVNALGVKGGAIASEWTALEKIAFA